MTLLEVMIAVAVISIALLGTMSVFINAERVNAVSREESIAQAAIAQKIAQIRATKFINIANPQNPPAGVTAGFSGGPYSGTGNYVNVNGIYVPDTTTYRLLPATYPVDVAGDQLSRGVSISTTPANGYVQMRARYYAPAPGAAEMRVILVNDEDPIESEIGEIAGNGDGCDLDQDGQILTTPYPVPAGWVSTGNNPTNGPEGINPPPSSFNAFPVAVAPNITGNPLTPGGATPLFPRRLGSGTPNPPIHQYLNITQMLVLPVVVQVRWWSAAGVPREITVITFITNRS
jgi:type II secretory pathway pseudopilin PulG